jgi:hypothetical protein
MLIGLFVLGLFGFGIGLYGFGFWSSVFLPTPTRARICHFAGRGCGVCSASRNFGLQIPNRKDQNLQENEHSNFETCNSFASKQTFIT